MAGRLTDTKIRAIPKPASGQSETSDSDVPGLRIRVGTSGVKTFILRKRVAGRLRNITLGRYGPQFGIAQARRKARDLLSDIEAGKGLPAAVPTGGIVTVRSLLPAYLDSKAHLRTHAEIERILRNYVLPELGDRAAEGITRGDVTRLIDAITVNTPSMARSVHAQLSAFYTWALPRLDLLDANPCRDAGRPAPSRPRERVLSDQELGHLWQLAEAEGAPWGFGVHLLMLTGARRDEVFSADRAEFDRKGKCWTIPAERSKNGRAHLVPLSPLALRVLAKIPKDDESGKLFPTRRKARRAESGPSGYSKAQRRLRAGMPESAHWTLHDIRRTVATGLQRLGVRFEVTEAVLNHVSGSRGGVAGVYQRHDWAAEKRDALMLWGAHVARIAKMSTPVRTARFPKNGEISTGAGVKR